MLRSLVGSEMCIRDSMETAPHRLPKDTIKQCRKDIFRREDGGTIKWGDDHPYFIISAWELEHHYTLAELQRFYGILKEASGGSTAWGKDPPPKLKGAMAALLVSGRDTLRPLLLQQPKE
eukprot:TRINITY_DN37465_c0_g1_i1.p1 TRINITY_DN37465_c0_g1~~TRINITY_DN37465_c0_g1_i1.p1  ORF type:complete len:120 (+),score=25.19 TRINITY_DN37465_c0_g1_i1:162-521(+)